MARFPPGPAKAGVAQSAASGTQDTGYPPPPPPLLLQPPLQPLPPLLLQPPLQPLPPPAPLAPVTLTRGFTLRS